MRSTVRLPSAQHRLNAAQTQYVKAKHAEECDEMTDFTLHVAVARVRCRAWHAREMTFGSSNGTGSSACTSSCGNGIVRNGEQCEIVGNPCPSRFRCLIFL